MQSRLGRKISIWLSIFQKTLIPIFAWQGPAPDRYSATLHSGRWAWSSGAFIMHSVQHDRGLSLNASGCLNTCFQPSSN